MYCYSLEVSLEKQREGEWTSLTAEEEEEEGAGLPLRGPVAEQLSEEELAELKRRVSEATKNKVNFKTLHDRQNAVCIGQCSRC